MTGTIPLLHRLVAFRTVSANSNLDLIAFIQNYLAERGFRISRVASPCEEKAGLFASLGPEGRGILLSAHSDVVPVTGQSWSRDPFRLADFGDRLVGRGTTDMKGFLASMLALADRAAGQELREPLKFAVSYDEEIGCIGMANMIDALPAFLGHPRACIVGEPTSMQVAIGHKGKVALRATCFGQSGHSALAPNFVNAIYMATDFIGELRDLQAWLVRDGARDSAYDIPFSTVHVGKLSSGIATNIVPEIAQIDLEFRHLPADTPERTMAGIRASAARVAAGYRDRQPRADIKVTYVNSYPGLDVPAGSDIARLARSLAGTDTVTKVAFGTEAGFFYRLGIPTVICGPGSMGDQGHKPDEYITKTQLCACDAMMDRILDALT